MKPIYITLFALIALVSCNNNETKEAYKQKSVGNINSLQILITDELWDDSVGEEIRNYFAASTEGLPQVEPLFSINQMDPSTFSGFIKSNRLFLHVTIGKEDKFTLVTNEYAKPQTGAIITAKTKEGLIKLIAEKQEEIIEAFFKSEIKERQRRTSISPLVIDSLKERFGLNIKMPSAYRIAHKGSDFYWLRKDLKKTGSTNILIYEVPLNLISNDSIALGEILTIRDSIGGYHLPVEDNGRFGTDYSYSPNFYITELDGNFAYKTKGVWDVKGEFMAGPFLNYAVKDEKNNRYLIIEGFTFAPAERKRNLQFELESIIKSAKINN
ncbi:MAG: DUF4837 family protein [Flavobacteriaceae bacterium]|jgi:hypothetical protein|nr:DUF4837 family protein [Flavobacteriaceae bacterium]MBT3920495.1 DUF4837 family protein [Flavobacteriaceae bacterium]MBT6704292.1 DUF4837 family protein [Flavobacteriaceae bacterium]